MKQEIIKRIFDIVFSLLGIFFVFPVLICTAFLVKLTSKGPVFYRQVRVGKNNKDFKIFKFRTMYIHSEKQGLLTIGDRDARITTIGYYLRKYKLDELPQLINVFIGNMSFVGPRPEVRKYVDLYTEEQLKIFVVKPGITDFASIKFRNESEILSKQVNPEKYYIEVLIPMKISLNLKYIRERSFFNDIKIIIKTLFVILK